MTQSLAEPVRLARADAQAPQALQLRHLRYLVAVAEAGTFICLMHACLTVWVKASPEQHMQRVIDQGDLRPMARSREAMRELKDILKAREPFYRQAHLHLTTSGRTADQSFEELLGLLGRGQ